MATLCSTLKYYGHAVIGVVRDIDKKIIIDAVSYFHHYHFCLQILFISLWNVSDGYFPRFFSWT
jgi:hypothetical protein